MARVGSSKNSSHDNRDFYSDDPDFVELPNRRKNLSSLLALVMLVVGGGFFLQTTLASNLKINSGASVEFGQGSTQVITCAASPANVIFTPRSTFTNVSGAGSHKFSSLTVSGIPDGCWGEDLTINAYATSDSTPLTIFNSTSTDAVIYDNAGTFEVGIGGAGMTITSAPNAFTITFTSPVASSANVFKLIIQSGAHTPNGFTPTYDVGNTGPGGGLIYYVDTSTGFSCGATYISTGSPTGGRCHYLEVAPYGWNGGDDPTKVWAVLAQQSNDVVDITNDSNSGLPYNNALGVGLGYKNSIAIVAQNGVYPTNDYAAGAARAYAGGSKSDWYLPTTAELNLLCQWDYGVAKSVTTICAGGTRNSATFGAGPAGISIAYYWSSSENVQNFAWQQLLDSGRNQQVSGKGAGMYVRPIRAF